VPVLLAASEARKCLMTGAKEAQHDPDAEYAGGDILSDAALSRLRTDDDECMRSASHLALFTER
jgi:hypothetical protein